MVLLPTRKGNGRARNGPPIVMLKAIRREPRDMPWYPEWTKRAECAKYDLVYVDRVFFDYKRNGRLIRKAKEICAVCPVIRQCYRQNKLVPLGIFYGRTALERWRDNGMKGYPSSNKPGFNFIANSIGE